MSTDLMFLAVLVIVMVTLTVAVLYAMGKDGWRL